MKYLLLISVITLLSLSTSRANNLDKLGYLTEQNAPFNYVDEKGDTRGLAVDILKKVWSKLGVKQQDIRVLPWARGYYLTLQKPNTVLFSTTRIDSRETLFKWACPIAYLRVVLVAKKSSEISLESLDDLSKYRVIAVRADVGEQMLLERGVDDTKIHLANQLDNAFKMIERDRMDLLSGGEVAIFSRIKELGASPEDYEVKWTLESNPLCYAFNRNMDDETIRIFQKALNDVQGDRQFIHKLLQKYGLLHN